MKEYLLDFCAGGIVISVIFSGILGGALLFQLILSVHITIGMLLFLGAVVFILACWYMGHKIRGRISE